MGSSPLRPHLQVIKSSGAVTSDTGYAFELPNDVLSGKLIVVASAASGTSPTADITLQTSYDGGTSYVMHSRFAQLTAAATRVLDFARTNMIVAGQEFAHATTGGADANNGPLARHCRVYVDVGGTSPSFTLSIFLVAERGR